MRQMCWWSIWDSFEVCNNFGVPRYSRNELKTSLRVTELLWSWEIQFDWHTIELLKRRVCSAVKRLVVLVNLNLFDITSTYMRWTHNWYYVWTQDTLKSCVFRQKIITSDGDIHCGTCWLYSLVDNVEPYVLFQCSEEYVKNDPYASFDWKDWHRIPIIRSVNCTTSLGTQRSIARMRTLLLKCDFAD